MNEYFTWIISSFLVAKTFLLDEVLQNKENKSVNLDFKMRKSQFNDRDRILQF